MTASKASALSPSPPCPREPVAGRAQRRVLSRKCHWAPCEAGRVRRRGGRWEGACGTHGVSGPQRLQAGTVGTLVLKGLCCLWGSARLERVLAPEAVCPEQLRPGLACLHPGSCVALCAGPGAPWPHSGVAVRGLPGAAGLEGGMGTKVAPLTWRPCPRQPLPLGMQEGPGSAGMCGHLPTQWSAHPAVALGLGAASGAGPSGRAEGGTAGPFPRPEE